MKAMHKVAGALALAGFAASCEAPYEPVRTGDTETVRGICAEVLVQFSPDSPILLPTARQAMLQTLNRFETDCEGAGVEIIAYAERAGDQMAYARTSAVESAIVNHYGVSDTRIAKQTRVAPRESLTDHVVVSLIAEVPVLDD